jgi:hypothetical protein
MNLSALDRHFEAVGRASNSAEAQKALVPIFDAYDVMSFEPNGITCWRARRTEGKPWAKFSEMTFPPSESATVQRLSNAGEPSLYAATRIETALIEIGACEGELIQLIGFRHLQNNGLRLALIGEFHHLMKRGYFRITNDPAAAKAVINTLGKMPREQYLSLLYADAFLDSLLSAKREDDPDYVRSRAVAALTYREPGLDGIAYPSVPDQHGMNVVIKPVAADKKLRSICVMLVRITRKYQFGFIEYEVTQDVERIETDGSFVWQPAQAVDRSRFFNLTKDEAASGLNFADDRIP